MPSDLEESLENACRSLESSLENMIPTFDSITKELDKFTENIDKHFKAVASSLLEYPVAASIRETIQSSPWLYDRSEPPLPPPVKAVPIGYIGFAQRWVCEHRAVTAAVVAFVGTGAFIIWRQRRQGRMKRRAKRAKNGARTEVVILAGSPHSPLTKSLSLDLERRGFIVYIPVNSISEEHFVQSEGRADIRPLQVDVASETSTTDAVSKFTAYINTPQHPLPHAPSHNLQLSSLILIPPIEPSIAPIATLSASTWSDTFNVNVVLPFTIIQAFLPLLVAQKATLMISTQSIVPSLKAASHAPESVIAASMDAYISTLRKETSAEDVNIVQLKLGSFDLGASSSVERQMIATANIARVEHPRWSAAARARHLKEQYDKLRAQRSKGSSLRELYNAVFDSMVRGKGRGGTIFVGRGAWTYDVVGRWVPGGIVGWMMSSKATKGRPAAGERRSSEGSQEWEKVESA